jgi:hypothetical protein
LTLRRGAQSPIGVHWTASSVRDMYLACRFSLSALKRQDMGLLPEFKRPEAGQNTPVERQPFLADIKAIRERAREHMSDGAVTAGYGKDPKQDRATGRRAGLFTRRLGYPVACGLCGRSNLREMIQENLVAERIAIDTYREMARWFGDDDPTTKRILESILAQEEEHADEMSDLLQKNSF